MKLGLPAAISMALCPITLFMSKPTVKFLWPPDKFKTLPDINQAIICFLMPSGMIYAIEDEIAEFMQLSSAITKTTSTSCNADKYGEGFHQSAETGSIYGSEG